MYWNGRGLAEPIRVMFNLAGVSFDDQRLNANPTGSTLEANLGRMPVLQVENKGTLGQSLAMYYYVASELGFNGSNNFEAAQILSISEHLRELDIAYRKLFPWGTTPDEAALKDFFENEEVNDFTGPAVQSGQGKRMMIWYLGRLNHIMPETGFSVGDKLSLADILLWKYFADATTTPEGKELAPFGSSSLMTAALAKFSKLNKIVENVRNHEKLKEYIVKRGSQAF
jgi:glutathione S-transferase